MPLLTVENEKIRLTNLEKVFWPYDGLTKEDLLSYYIRISPYLLPYVKDRSITIVPYPKGIEGPFFYQKRLPAVRPAWLSSHKRGTKEAYPLIQSLKDLVWLANRGTVEIHTGFYRLDRPEFPDILAFDLDPTPKVPFAKVLEVALALKEILKSFALNGYPKTSGQNGLHIYVPVKPNYHFSKARKALKNIALVLCHELPKTVTLEWLKKKRFGVYLDYRQYGEKKTLVAPYSLRPTKRGTISTPLPWSYVQRGGFSPLDFRLETLLDFVEKEGDPFLPLLNNPQDLPPILYEE